MLPHVDIRGIALLIAGVLLGFAGLRQWHLRRLASRIFADHGCNDTALGEVREVLEEINRECPTHKFFAARLSRMSLRDHPLSIVDGWVVVPTEIGANSDKCVFAVAHRDEADWVRNFSDVFELAFSGSVWSVFWVRLPILMRLTRRYPPQPPRND